MPRFALAALLLSAMGCINQDAHLYEINLHGTVTVPPPLASSGALHLAFYLANRAGEGGLAHPLELFERRVLPAVGMVDEQVLYPLDIGDGLVIYGYVDSDGDGTLCARGAAPEPAGLTVLASAPEHELQFQLRLDQLCKGPEALFP